MGYITAPGGQTGSRIRMRQGNEGAAVGANGDGDFLALYQDPVTLELPFFTLH